MLQILCVTRVRRDLDVAYVSIWFHPWHDGAYHVTAIPCCMADVVHLHGTALTASSLQPNHMEFVTSADDVGYSRTPTLLAQTLVSSCSLLGLHQTGLNIVL